jgi:hypothetical protein
MLAFKQGLMAPQMQHETGPQLSIYNICRISKQKSTTMWWLCGFLSFVYLSKISPLSTFQQANGQGKT